MKLRNINIGYIVTEKNLTGKRKKNEHDPVEDTLRMQNRKSMKKNLATDRMEKLRDNLKTICNDDNINNNIFTNDTRKYYNAIFIITNYSLSFIFLDNCSYAMHLQKCRS